MTDAALALTSTELEQAIVAASLAYIAARRSGDPQAISDAKAVLDALILMRNATV